MPEFALDSTEGIGLRDLCDNVNAGIRIAVVAGPELPEPCAGEVILLECVMFEEIEAQDFEESAFFGVRLSVDVADNVGESLHDDLPL